VSRRRHVYGIVLFDPCIARRLYLISVCLSTYISIPPNFHPSALDHDHPVWVVFVFSLPAVSFFRHQDLFPRRCVVFWALPCFFPLRYCCLITRELHLHNPCVLCTLPSVGEG
jgi:hypothetical protein